MDMTQEYQQIRQIRFKKLAVATFLYAVFYTFCMYHNLTGITMPLWIVATICYACYALKRFDIPRKKDGAFHIVVMVLLGVSTVLTGNPYITILNYLGFFALLLSFLLHMVHDDAEWGIGTYIIKATGSVLGAMVKLTEPFLDCAAFRKIHPHKPTKKTSYVMLGFLMALPCLFFLTVLLASADAVFANLLDSTLTCVIFPANWFGAILLFLFAFFSAYCGLCQLLEKQNTTITTVRPINKISSTIAITFTAPITILYVIFSLIQIVYLFLGFGTLPYEMSYAEYARTGFFQLVFVCFLNFALVLIVQNYVEKSKLLKGILLTICGATFIMIASSTYRMFLYISVYQLTFLRVFVLVALAIITFLMVGVVITLFKERFSIYKYSLIVVSILYLGFSFSHADYFIASYNLAHMMPSTSTDTLEYIKMLSSDAAPAIAKYMKENDIHPMDTRTASNTWYIDYCDSMHSLGEDLSFRNFNLSHYIASKVIEL